MGCRICSLGSAPSPTQLRPQGRTELPIWRGEHETSAGRARSAVPRNPNRADEYSAPVGIEPDVGGRSRFHAAARVGGVKLAENVERG